MSLKLTKTKTPQYCNNCTIIMGTTWIIDVVSNGSASQICLCDSCAKDLYKQMTIEMYLDKFCKNKSGQEFSIVINDSELSEYTQIGAVRKVKIPVNIPSPLGFIYYEIWVSIDKILKWAPIPGQKIKETVVETGPVKCTIKDQTKYEFQFIGTIQ